jgi:N,N'-diacetyllegionaminate synthase
MSTRTLIIAEAGVNHNGSMDLAKKLIDAAVNAGVDIVKFQTFKAEKIASKKAGKAEYQKQTTGESESQLAMLKKLELGEEDHDELIAYCAAKNITFLSTPFDRESIDLLKAKGITIGKVPSGEITNLPYLEAMAKAFEKIILSTGMALMEEVKAAVEVLLKAGTLKKNLTVLHCNTEYPTPMRDVNLKAMHYIKDELDLNIGYSDHTLGIEVPIAAVALGATIIEKHFTLDRTMEGPDHRASLEPQELKAMVAAIRNVELAIEGSGVKEPSASEIKNIAIARKSIVAARPIRKGEILSEDKLAVKRPGTGISPMMWYQVRGTEAVKDFDTDELIVL